MANAEKKARAYAEASGLPTLADDSGLIVDALGGRPGVESSRFGGPELSDADRNRLLLNLMERESERGARYMCVICLAGRGHAGHIEDPQKVFVGRCEGRIAKQPRGSGGFGYDAIFLLPDGRTMAELPAGAKDAISHRAVAVMEMLQGCDLAAWAAVTAREIIPGVKRRVG